MWTEVENVTQTVLYNYIAEVPHPRCRSQWMCCSSIRIQTVLTLSNVMVRSRNCKKLHSEEQIYFVLLFRSDKLAREHAFEMSTSMCDPQT